MMTPRAEALPLQEKDYRRRHSSFGGDDRRAAAISVLRSCGRARRPPRAAEALRRLSVGESARVHYIKSARGWRACELLINDIFHESSSTQII